MRMRLTNLPELRLIVAEQHLTQRQLADKAGIACGTVGNLLAGRRTGCSAEVYTSLVHVLGVEVRDVFEPRVPKSGRRTTRRAA